MVEKEYCIQTITQIKIFCTKVTKLVNFCIKLYFNPKSLYPQNVLIYLSSHYTWHNLEESNISKSKCRSWWSANQSLSDQMPFCPTKIFVNVYPYLSIKVTNWRSEKVVQSRWSAKQILSDHILFLSDHMIGDRSYKWPWRWLFH